MSKRDELIKEMKRSLSHGMFNGSERITEIPDVVADFILAREDKLRADFQAEKNFLLSTVEFFNADRRRVLERVKYILSHPQPVECRYCCRWEEQVKEALRIIDKRMGEK